MARVAWYADILAEFLESAAIAWPNHKMWKEIKVPSTVVDYTEAHAHSPPRKSRAQPQPDPSWTESQPAATTPMTESQDWLEQYHTALQRTATRAPNYQGHSRRTASDFSMPDCSPPGYRDYPWMAELGHGLEVPKNTPQSVKGTAFATSETYHAHILILLDAMTMSTAFDNTYVDLSLLNQPSPDHAGKLKSILFPLLPTSHGIFDPPKEDGEEATSGDSCTPPEFSYLAMVRQPASTPANNMSQKASQMNQASPSKVFQDAFTQGTLFSGAKFPVLTF